VPLIAVGNVPCDGTNPPKYLDAEFNFLQILNADGVWQEAEDGVEIVVSAGRPVRARASVGNTQETTWRDCKSEDMNRYVGLAVCEKTDGRELSFLALPRSGHSAVSSGIPYLGDADFGEFTLLKPMSESSFVSPIALSVRMELLVRGSRVPFGEERLFTLREKK